MKTELLSMRTKATFVGLIASVKKIALLILLLLNLLSFCIALSTSH